MKKLFATFMASAALTAQAALPTLSGLAESLANLTSDLTDLRGHYAFVTNRLADSGKELAELRAKLLSAETRQDRIVWLIEANGGLREAWHGGKIGSYIVTNENRRLIRVDLYADASVWTNGTTQAVQLPKDPEALAKEMARRAAEHERVVAAWEAANLPPDLAALRARQREAARQESQEGATAATGGGD